MLGRPLERRERQEAMRRSGRLPPGQSLTQKFPVLHYGRVPGFNPASWDFRIWGAVDEQRRWTWDELMGLPKTIITMDIHCVTRWSKFDTQWEGISLQRLIDAAGIRVDPEARYLMQHCEAGFTTNLPLAVALSDSFLLATHFDGKPLTPAHGYPLRGVVGHIPGRDDLKTVYLWKGGKWLRGLEFMRKDRLGFWEQAGYHNEADVWKEQRMTSRW